VRALDPAPVLRSGYGAIEWWNWREETEMIGLTAPKTPYKQLHEQCTLRVEAKLAVT